MRYMATIYLSDVMDQVAATLELQGWSELYGPPETLLVKTFVWPGFGDDEPSQWLQRFLHRMWQDIDAPPRVQPLGGVPMGGPHTISETGDIGI